MRKILLAIFVCCISIFAKAQGTSSKIADILAAMPAQDKAQLDKNMGAISGLGEKGIADMASMLMPAGSGDNTAIEYAIGGYSNYVMQPGKEPQRQMAVAAYCTALQNLKDNTSRQFIIKQLQQIGKDDAVPTLEKYLQDEQLCGAAARALAQINTTGSSTALLNALAGAKSGLPLPLIEALGYARYKPAVKRITEAANTDEPQLRKICLYALARIGDAGSAALLQQAVQKAGFTLDNTESLAAFVLYIHTISNDGNSTEAEKLANDLMRDADKAGQGHAKIAALKLLVEIKGAKSLPLLYKAMQDKDIKYRGAALEFAMRFQSPEADKEWLLLLPKIKPAAQVQVIDFLARTGDETILQPLLNLLKDNDKQIRLACITATRRIGGSKALPALLTVMKKGDSDEIAAVRNNIILMKGDGVTASVAAALPAMPVAGKVALLNILEAREADDQLAAVMVQLNSSDIKVHEAAVEALHAVVKVQDLSTLYPLLNAAKPADIKPLQKAVIVASAGMQDTAERTAVIVTAMNNAGDKKALYFDVLAAIGSKQAFNELRQAFENGDAQTKNAAIEALSKTTGAKAARLLMHIAQLDNGAYTQRALDGYIAVIHASVFPADQKLVMLKDAMALAQNDDERKEILNEAANCQTFLALIFAGDYVDYAPIQQEAAHAVMDIALSHKEFNGDIVKGLLIKVMSILNDKDADYERQAIKKHLAEMPQGDGFVSMFDGKGLAGWKGLVANPIDRAKMNADTLAREQQKADSIMRKGWFAKDGLLVFSGDGENLCTTKQYGDFEMFVDWKITKDGDAGIYLRGSPQVQIWDTSRVNVGAQVGSGGLYNNQKYESKPLALADNAIGEWNSFHIIMRGDKVTVYLNGILVTDKTILENYWDRSLPIFAKEQIELQAHGTYVAYRNLYIKELTGSEPFALSNEEKQEGFKVLFDGSNLDLFTGDKAGYKVRDGNIYVDTLDAHPGNMFTKQEYGNFILRFEFQLTPGANNGIGIRAPLEGDAAYVGMEIQVLDNEADMYKDLHPYQYHGSVYGVIPAKRGYLKPVGEWNYEEIVAYGPNIKVTLNNTVILDGNIDEASKNGTIDRNQHPGLKRQTGHIGFLGHGSIVQFRNVRVKEL